MHDITPRTAGTEGQTSIIYLTPPGEGWMSAGSPSGRSRRCSRLLASEYPGDFLERTVAERVLPGRDWR